MLAIFYFVNFLFKLCQHVVHVAQYPEVTLANTSCKAESSLIQL